MLRTHARAGVAIGLALLSSLACLWAAAPADQNFAAVTPGRPLQFPRDFGSHPQYRIEWWYVTGWLTTAAHETLGFQVTFFRARPTDVGANPSTFAPRQLLFAHCALSDPRRGRPWEDQRIRRAGFELADADTTDTRVWIDDWQLRRAGSGYTARVAAEDFGFELTLAVTQPPLANGEGGYSRKGPDASSASDYYSQPHLRVSGGITRAGHSDAVTGEAWLDHEWTSEYLDPAAAGWDWFGLNLDDGGAIMAFRIRDRQGASYWAGGTVRYADGTVEILRPEQIEFQPRREWRSPHTGVRYPIVWRVRVGALTLELEPLLDDQEIDARLTSGAVYWEGAVRARQQQSSVGRGYLELTGYGQPLSRALSGANAN
jgi:predicted secreted hydrolase